MAIARCVETRLAEGVWTLLAADTDLKTLCASASATKPRIYLGLSSVAPSSLVPPQINVVATPGDPWEPGVSGERTYTLPVTVYYFEQNPYASDDQSLSGGGSSALDVMAHIQRKLWLGDDGNYRGTIYDPDAVGNVSICTTVQSMDIQDAAPSDDRAALVWAMRVTYLVKLLNNTRERQT